MSRAGGDARRPGAAGLLGKRTSERGAVGPVRRSFGVALGGAVGPARLAFGLALGGAFGVAFGVGLGPSPRAAAEPRAAGFESAFPCTLSLRAAHHFFLYGEEIAPPLVFTCRDNRFSINGRQALPPVPATPAAPLPDATLRALYGGVPSFRACVASGGPAGKCAETYEARRDTMVARIRAIYQERSAAVCDWAKREIRAALRDGTASPAILDGLDAAATAALRALDPDVVGDLAEARRSARISRAGVLTYRVPGQDRPVTVDLGHRRARRAGQPDPSLPERAMAIVQELRIAFDADSPVVACFARGGDLGLKARGDDALGVLAEIDSVRANPEYVPARFGPGIAREFRDAARKNAGPGRPAAPARSR